MDDDEARRKAEAEIERRSDAMAASPPMMGPVAATPRDAEAEERG